MSVPRIEFDYSETLPAAQHQPACGYTAEDYAQVLSDLLPRGWAWPIDPETILMLVISGLAVEFSRVHARVCDLLTEAYPGTALETLSDWERVTGLPDDCLPANDSLTARRQAVLLKLAARGGASKEYFIRLMAALGFRITITEFEPFRTGQNRATHRLYGQNWMYAWRITAPQETVTPFRVGQNTAGDRLRTWGNAVIECILNRLKPAHTILQFGFGEAA